MTDLITNLVRQPKTLIMGIMNITPDSFSGDGLLQSNNKSQMLDKALQRAQYLKNSGADILDIGAESTRPGAVLVEEQEEIDRLIPVVYAISERIDIGLSIDTRKSRVARLALENGAHIINDISGLRDDPFIIKVAQEQDAMIIIVHNKPNQNLQIQKNNLGSRFVDNLGTDNQITYNVKNDLINTIDLCLKQGLKNEQIWIDPGFGFNKTTQQNLELLANLNALSSLPYPLVLGVSRKSMIGFTANVPVEQRLGGSLGAMLFGVEKGAKIVRVHDVFESCQAIRFIEKMKEY